VSVITDGNRRSLQLDLDSMKDDVPLGIMPHIDPVVGSLTPGFPAQAAGVEPGDTILSVEGTPFTHWNEMAQIIHSSPGKPLTIEVRRDTAVMIFEVIPRLDEGSGRGLVGISPRTESNIKRYPFVESIKRGFNRNIDLLGLTFGFLGELLTFKASIKNLGGPIMIFQVTGQAARAGVAEFLAFMAFLSLQLGVLNLLPIPVLDGGHLIFLGAEGALGKPIKPQAVAMAQRVGFFLLILLILVISYNDIVRLLANR
jgi:regulator of sigma E protease